MLSRVTARLTYANIVSSLALFLVLSGGTAVALTGSNTVFSDDIKNGEVKSGDVGADSVTGAKVANRSLGPGDIAPNSLTAGRLAPNSAGASEIAGNAVSGPKVANNSLKGDDIDESSLKGVPLGQYEVVQRGAFGAPSDGAQYASPKCPAGKLAVGGGARVYGPTGEPNPAVALQSNGPSRVIGTDNLANGWYAHAREVDGGEPGDWGLEVYAICAATDITLPD